MRQYTEEEATWFAEGGKWKEMSAKEIVDLQLYQDRLCVPFNTLHKSIEEVLGRSVYTHEFGFVKNLRKEYEGKCGKPSFEDIVNLIPNKNRIILFG